MLLLRSVTVKIENRVSWLKMQVTVYKVMNLKEMEICFRSGKGGFSLTMRPVYGYLAHMNRFDTDKGKGACLAG